MNCPICKTKIESPTGDEEIYYDCSVCNSSLLLKSTGLEILNEGSLAEAPVNKPTPEKSPVDALPSEESLGESPEEAIPPEESLKESSPDDLLPNEGLDESPSPENQDFKATDLKEEEVFDQEPTQVPVLNQPEEIPKGLNPKEEDNLAQDLQKDIALETKQSTQKEPFVEEENATQEESSFEENQEFSQKNTPQEKSPGEESVFTKDKPLEEDLSTKKRKKEDFSEVAEFANSQNPDKQGPYLYDLILSEINSQDLRQQVLTVLEDESLKLAEKEENSSLKDKIKDGKMVIKKISPVQAYVIVTSLMGLPLDIFWKQTHFTNK